jgi:type IV pilus assembly protein PilM
MPKVPNVNLDVVLEFLRMKTPALIGVDISSSYVKMVELKELPQKTGLMLECYSTYPLPKDAVSDGNINNLDAVAESLQHAWRNLGSRVKNICLALPAAAVTTKKILLPAGMSEDDLEFQVESEANQYIPFPLDEVNLDFQVIGLSPNNPDEVEVMLAASRKANVEDRVATAQVAGLNAVVMDVEVYAAERAFELVCSQLPNNAQDKCVALVDIGTNSTSVNVLRNGQSLYIRDQQIGGGQLTRQIEAMFGMSEEEAEAAKRSGNLPDNYESSVLTPFIDNMVMEIYRLLQIFFTSTQYSEVDYIVLAGGCAVLPGLDDAVANKTQVVTMVANPFALMTLSDRIKSRQLQLDAPSLMVACGLAMRRLD